MSYLWIGLGGALGSMLRFWLATAIGHRWGEAFPTGTLFVNVTGSFLIGLVASWGVTPDGPLPHPTLRQFLMVGVLGGYTTFSAFSLQTLHLLRSAHWLAAGLNVLGSVALCLVAVWLGHLVAQAASR
jgi:fluoride exporter